ncbi:MAG: ubiquinone/menaquinone biosynthesis methyltransferase [Deltaproteobacteria bacterium]|nr:ubiquinone/menaquinone biosynthesis methyltransferase [Deltaproteobacteria bacterium]
MAKIKLKSVDFTNPENKKDFNGRLFSEVAPTYNFLTKVLSLGRDGAWKNMLIKLLPEKKASNCLDIACGTGDITFRLADKFSEGEIIGIDLNADMLEIAKLKNNYPNIKFELKDMNHMDFEDNCFDVICGGYALRNSPDLTFTLKEIKRIMKDNGKAVFLDFSKSNNAVMQRLTYFILAFWGSLWGIILHGNPDVYAYIAESLKYYPDRIKLREMLKELGFKNIEGKLLFGGMLEILKFEK